MRELPTALRGPRLFELDRFVDERGAFMEAWRKDRFEAAGISEAWVQDNHSTSRRGVVRGMHLQVEPGQAKLVRVVAGRAFDVVVDVRPSSPTYRRWEAFELQADDGRALYIPPGFGHGFCALAERTDLLYKVSVAYDPTREHGFAWDDPSVGIAWPIDEPILSARDASLPPLEQLNASGVLE